MKEREMCRKRKKEKSKGQTNRQRGERERETEIAFHHVAPLMQVVALFYFRLVSGLLFQF
jgi:hypothetical protein